MQQPTTHTSQISDQQPTTNNSLPWEKSATKKTNHASNSIHQAATDHRQLEQ
jgi:hypothetical protein